MVRQPQPSWERTDDAVVVELHWARTRLIAAFIERGVERAGEALNPRVRPRIKRLLMRELEPLVEEFRQANRLPDGEFERRAEEQFARWGWPDLISGAGTLTQQRYAAWRKRLYASEG